MGKLRVKIRKVLIILLIIWMIVVFCLSNQNGDSSSSLSKLVANFFANGDVVESQKIEPMIRKMAHMIEYAIGGIIFFGITLTYPKLSNKVKIIMSLAFIIFYAGTDELHQSYVDNRNGSFWDVIIDIMGGLMGIVAVNLTVNSINTIENKAQQALKNK